MKSVIWGALLALGLAAPSAAQDAEVARGRAIAETWCVTCHAIGDGNQPSALADAPPFRTLAARPGFGEDLLRQALLLPHPVMPEFPVTTEDIAALAAYIATLTDAAGAGASQRADGLPEAPTTTTAEAEQAPQGDADDLAMRGFAIVQRDCSPCHLVEGRGTSPVPDAPAFATLSELYPVEHLAEALAEGIMVPHETVQMPTFTYEADDVGAIIAHLERVQTR